MTDQAQTTTEPVAWRIRPKGALGDVMGFQIVTNPYVAKDYADQPAFEVQPLYTTPQPLAIGLDREAVARVIVDRTGAGTLGLTDEASMQAAYPPADEIVALAAPAEGWQEIETAPEDGPGFLVCTERRNIYTVFRRSDEGDRFLHFGGGTAREVHETVTGWLPITCLPAAPTGETGA